MTTAMRSRDIDKIDRRIAELWRTHERMLKSLTANEHARLWRQIDALLDQRLELTT